MTPQTIKNMKESFSEDAEDYDGWDDLNGERICIELHPFRRS